MNQFDAVRIRYAQQTGFGQNIIRPRAMRRQRPKQPRAFGQPREQEAIAPRQPAIEGAFAAAFQRIQNTDRHQFTRRQQGLRVLGDTAHPVINTTKQSCDKVHGGHRAGS
jgi:hypothetical protein